MVKASEACRTQELHQIVVAVQCWIWTSWLAAATLHNKFTRCKCTNQTSTAAHWLTTKLCKAIKISQAITIKCKECSITLKTRRGKTNCQFRSRISIILGLISRTSKTLTNSNSWQWTMPVCHCHPTPSSSKTRGPMITPKIIVWLEVTIVAIMV